MTDETKVLWQNIIKRKAQESNDPEMLAAIKEADDITNAQREATTTFCGRVWYGLIKHANDNVGSVVKWILGLMAGCSLAITYLFTEGAMGAVKKVLSQWLS